jgi:hypothetical protein
MAPRARPAPLGAGNFAGSFPAALNDWRNGARRFHFGTGLQDPTHTMPDIRLQALSLQVITLDSLSPLREESIYES